MEFPVFYRTCPPLVPRPKRGGSGRKRNEDKEEEEVEEKEEEEIFPHLIAASHLNAIFVS